MKIGFPVRTEFDVEGVLRAFGEMPAATELEYLQWVLWNAERGREYIDEAFSAWMRGDLSVDEREDDEIRARYPAFYDRLIRQRNKAWVPRIDAMLRRPGCRFLAVGFGHIVGPEGVPVLAEQLGTIERVL